MIAPKSWLLDFVSLSGLSDHTFATEMTFAGNKVESVKTVGNETVYEFEITSNRPDTLCIYGIAREASSIFKRPFRSFPKLRLETIRKRPISLRITERELCPVFSVAEIDHVTVRPSSANIQKRLTLCGVRPINNVVDITNYLMLETGQPMHAFDASTLKGTLTLRAALPGERIVPLDHKERILIGGEIIIEDQEKLVDLAGLMGGENSEISKKTTRVYLLVPVYNPVSIRRASKHLRLRTEASTRFEKNLDLTQTEFVTRQAIQLLKREASGRQKTQIVTRGISNWNPPIIALPPKKVRVKVGISFSKKEIHSLLRSVGINQVPKGFTPPSWRRDIAIPEDLIEEVTRLYGYNRLPRTFPSGTIPIHSDALKPNWKRIIAGSVTSLGYTEVYSSTLIGKEGIQNLGWSTKNHLRVLYPMSEDYEFLRRSILETLIPTINQNSRFSENVHLFEIGTVFKPGTRAEDLPDQPLQLGMVSTTKNFALFKGHIEGILRALGIPRFTDNPTLGDQDVNTPLFTSATGIVVEKTLVGVFGKIQPKTLNEYSPVAFGCELDLTELMSKATNAFSYPKQSMYPPIIEDLTLKRPDGKYLADLLERISQTSSLITKVEFVGEYYSYVTLRLTFQSFTKSLTQALVNGIKESVLEKASSLGWVRRPAERSNHD